MAEKNIFEKVVDALNTPLPAALNKSLLPTKKAQAKEAPKTVPTLPKTQPTVPSATTVDKMTPATDLNGALAQRDNALRAAKAQAAENEALRKQVDAMRAELNDLRRQYEKTQAVEAQVHADTEDWTYTVVRGDTLSGIAKRLYGKAGRWPEIHKANQDKIKNPNLIYPGQVLIIPRD